ncbi:MAG: FAD-dependent oxidoreductase [Nanoarchaeota archaeon]|nr:FAD-dependent oxidoreductase [Nanoarchaeota archaeon]
MNSKNNLIIIGGGGAGLFCGATVLQLSKQFNVYLISDDDLYCRCSSPYVLTKKADLKDVIMPDSMITQFGIKLLKGSAKSINLKEHLVYYGDINGTTKIHFDYLMFATGSRAFVPPIPGVNLENVYSVRSSKDVKNINSKVKNSKKAVVIGGGVAGVEMASALVQRGLKVDLMIMEDKPFENMADLDFRELIEENLKNNKVNIINNVVVNELSGIGKVKEVIYRKGHSISKLKTDMVILATGVRANKELAENIGVQTVMEGIIVNDYMGTNIRNVFAAGDVVLSTNYVSKTKTLSQLATNAVIQGKVAGKNIAGFKTKYRGHTSAMMFSFFGDEFGSCGVTEEWCKKREVKYYVGESHSSDVYQDLKGDHKVYVKLIFNFNTDKIIGVQAYGKNIVWIVNLISYAIMQNSTVFDLADFDYASHPSVRPWPFVDPIVDACEHALGIIREE